jgi:hypothetical protein
MFSKDFTFKARLWIWNAQKGSWHFVSLPRDISAEIKDGYPFKSKGFGSVPVTVTIGETEWKTSIFPDSKRGQYILPIKAAVRKVENLNKDDTAEVKIHIEF